MEDLLSWEYQISTHWGYWIGLSLFDVVACHMVGTKPLPHSLWTLKNDLYWTLKQIRRISFWKCYSKCRLPPSLCWISVHLYVSTLTICLPETRVYHFSYCHGWIIVLGIPDFNSLRLLMWALSVWCDGLLHGQRQGITSPIINP